MKIFVLILAISISGLVMYSCSKHCNCPDTIKLQDAFKLEVNENKYCDLINSSLKDDSMAFRQLVNYPINDGLMIDHSNNICHLSVLIGQEKICSWIDAGIIDSEKLSQVMRFGAFHFFSPREREKYLNKSLMFICDSTSSSHN